MKTRQPTGTIPAPLLLLQGPAKAGKTTAALQASRAIKGRTLVFDMGDGAADAYAALGDFEIVETDGTWQGFIADLEEATKTPDVDCIIIDSASIVWDQLSLWADQLARRSPSGRKALAADPDAEVTTTMAHWNAAKDRWGRMLFLLRRWNGVAILIALTEEVAVVDGQGRPTKQKTVVVKAEKRLAANSTVIVHINERHIAQFLGGIVPQGLIEAGTTLPDDNEAGPVGWLITQLGETAPSEIRSLSALDDEQPVETLSDESWQWLTGLADAEKQIVKEHAMIHEISLKRGSLTEEHIEEFRRVVETETIAKPETEQF